MQPKQFNWFVAAFLLIIFLAAFLRIYALELRPLHHDEGVNSFFALRLYRNQTYHYDPTNYHGPLLFYATLPFFFLFGESIFALRAVLVFFGLATILLLLPLKKYLGERGILVAALLIALSPTLTFYSRYYIHETLFVFLTIAVISSFVLSMENRKAIYGLLLSIALLAAVKESFWLVLAIFSSFLLLFFLRNPTKGKEFLGVINKNKRTIFIALVVSLAVFVLLYSSFLQNLGAVYEFFLSPLAWGKTAVAGVGHEKNALYYLELLVKLEPLALIGAAGAVLSAAFLVKKKQKIPLFLLFAAYWILLGGFFYSAVPYKTPWLVVNITLPLIILASWFFGNWIKKIWSIRSAFFLALVVLVLATNAWANFVFYESSENPLVYVHTTSEVKQLVELVEGMGNPSINIIMSPNYWPLPWYFRDYDVMYTPPDYIQPDCTRDVIITTEGNMLNCDLQGYSTHHFKLREGVELAVFTKNKWVN